MRLEAAEVGRMLGSEIVTAVGLLDILEAIAAVRARWCGELDNRDAYC